MMDLAVRRKWDGALSLAWVSAVFVGIKYGHFSTSSAVVGFVVVFGAWWGVGMLLAASGLKSRSVVGVLPALVTTACFLYFVWTLIPRSVHVL
jgi:hypothetical protein